MAEYIRKMEQGGGAPAPRKFRYIDSDLDLVQV